MQLPLTTFQISFFLLFIFLPILFYIIILLNGFLLGGLVRKLSFFTLLLFSVFTFLLGIVFFRIFWALLGLFFFRGLIILFHRFRFLIIQSKDKIDFDSIGKFQQKP